jgi:thiamine-phosphate pyrophosphorylase
MADSLARAQLARAADTLHRAAQSALPALVLLTDDQRLPDPRAAILALPRGSLVVLRAREESRRIALAHLIVRPARERGLRWIVADDPELAARTGADGAHFPERKIAMAAHWRTRRPSWLITGAAHSLGACQRAAAWGVDAVLLGPVFPTESHPARPHLGSVRVRIIARAARVAVYALGGIDAQTARRLDSACLAGLAAIGALATQ